MTSVDGSGTYAMALRRRRYTTALTPHSGRPARPAARRLGACVPPRQPAGALPRERRLRPPPARRARAAARPDRRPPGLAPRARRPDLGPRDLLDLFAAWLGIELDESWPEERRRELLRRAPELARRRGTRAGLELNLAIAFPDLPLRVEESGGVSFGDQPAKRGKGGRPEFVVYCDMPIDEARQAAVARVIDHARPVHVSYRLRVKAAPQRG